MNQNYIFYQIGFDFTIIMCKEGLGTDISASIGPWSQNQNTTDINTIEDYPTMTDDYNLGKGDIIKSTWLLKKPPYDSLKFATLYIESVIRDNKEIILNRETILSWSFLITNISNGLFTDITKIINRDNKIDKLIW